MMRGCRRFEEHGLDPLFYTHRQRRTDEVFPWEHITAAVRKNFLFQDFRIARGRDPRGLPPELFRLQDPATFANMRRNPGDVWKCPDVKSPVSTNPYAMSSLKLPVVGD